MLDPRPYETHQFYPRGAANEHRRNQLRNAVSWHMIANYRNHVVFRSGVLGLVTAPIVAGISSASPQFLGINMPIQMGLIFLAGLLFVSATLLYQSRVPEAIERYFLDGTSKSIATPEQLYRSFVYKQFLDLRAVQEITRSNLKELEGHKINFETAAIILLRNGRCYKVGFDVYALALIEKLLYRLAEDCGFNFYEEYERDDGERGLRKRSGPNVTYQSGDVFIRHMSLEPVSNHPVGSLTPERVEGKFSSRDLVLKLYDPGLSLPQDVKSTERFVSGLEYLLDDSYRSTLQQELSYWKAWSRPFSRLLTLLLFYTSIAATGLFMLFQIKVVIGAVQI